MKLTETNSRLPQDYALISCLMEGHSLIHSLTDLTGGHTVIWLTCVKQVKYCIFRFKYAT